MLDSSWLSTCHMTFSFHLWRVKTSCCSWLWFWDVLCCLCQPSVIRLGVFISHSILAGVGPLSWETSQPAAGQRPSTLYPLWRKPEPAPWTLPMLRLLSSTAQGCKRFLKTFQTLSCWYSLDSSHQVLWYEYECATVSVIFWRFLASFCIGQNSHQLHTLVKSL